MHQTSVPDWRHTWQVSCQSRINGSRESRFRSSMQMKNNDALLQLTAKEITADIVISKSSSSHRTAALTEYIWPTGFLRGWSVCLEPGMLSLRGHRGLKAKIFGLGLVASGLVRNAGHVFTIVILVASLSGVETTLFTLHSSLTPYLEN